MKIYILIAVSFAFLPMGKGQINLQNASFEGEPQDATTPIGWLECERGTTPDILPGYWGVYKEPYHGETYVGLITRSNGSWEAIGQRLESPLKEDQCYSITMQIAYSELYAGYNEPIKLRIWGGNKRCEKTQLFGESPIITHEDWKSYSFKFTPKDKIRYIIFEAYYNTDKEFTHNGNILLDHISAIIWCPRA